MTVGRGNLVIQQWVASEGPGVTRRAGHLL